jgi:hypothetical protein
LWFWNKLSSFPSFSFEKQVQHVLQLIDTFLYHVVGLKKDGGRFLTRKAQEATTATALLPVQVCAVAPLGEVSHPTLSSNSARATFIPA